MGVKMGTWKYGIIFHRNSRRDYYALHEVYYVGGEMSYGNSPIVVGDSSEEVVGSIRTMLSDAEGKGVQLIVEDPEPMILESLYDQEEAS
jgi:hypothetical protein